MSGLLEGLAQGLRSAGGTLSKGVYDVNAQQDAAALADSNAQRNLLLQNMMQSIQSGAVQAPEALRGIVGQSPVLKAQLEENAANAEKRREEVSTRRKISEGVAGLSPEDRANPLKLAEVFLLNGDHATGAKYIDTHETRLARAQASKDALDAKMIQLEQMSLDKTASREQQARIAQMQDETRRQGQALTAQIAAGNQALRELAIRTSAATQAGNADARNAKTVDTQIGTLANHLQQYKIPGLVASVQSANDILKKYEDGDIPGMGIVAGSGKIPNVLRSQEANDVRSSIQAATNDLLNMYSGLAVTLPEGERRDLEQMRGGDFSVGDFKNAWPRVVKRLNSVVGNMRASVPPQALQEYQARPGAMNMNPIVPAFDAKPEGQWSDDKEKRLKELKAKLGK